MVLKASEMQTLKGISAKKPAILS
jgi:hypothetical protein